MKAIIISGFIAVSVLASSPTQIISLELPPPLTTDQLITKYATEYKVSEKVMHKVIKCESTYNPNAVGDGGKSFGLVQIHLPSNPTVTKEQALDKEFAVEFLAKGLSTGRGRAWTCFRSIPNV